MGISFLGSVSSFEVSRLRYPLHDACNDVIRIEVFSKAHPDVIKID